MKRLWMTAGMLALVSVVCAMGLRAQELSDGERLKYGIELYNNKKYQESIEVLQEVDPSNLPAFDKNRPALYIKQATKGLEDQKGATGQITLGEQALMNKRYVTALSRFQEAKKLDYLSEAGARRLESLITVAKDGEKNLRATVLETLAEAKAAEAAGSTDSAIVGYKAVLAADVYLPATDKDYAQTHLAALTGKPAVVPAVVRTTVPDAPAEKPKPADGIRPVVTPSDDQPTPKSPDTSATPVTTPVVTPAVTPVKEPVKVAVVTPAVTPVKEPVKVVVVTPAVTPVKVAVVTPVKEPVAAVDVDALRRQAMAARAAEQIAKGDAAMEANDLRAARMAYARALAIDPKNAVAKAGLETVEGLLGRGTRSLLAKEADRAGVEEQRVVAKVREALKKARAVQEVADQPRDYDGALEQLRYASRLIEQSSVLRPERAEDLREEVRDLWMSVNQAKMTRAGEVDVARVQQIHDREDARKRADEAARKRQIESLWTTSQQFVSRHKYTEAVAVLDQLLVIKPDHEKARRFRGDYSFLAGLADQIGVRQDRRRENQLALADTETSAIPWNEIYRYPSAKEWQDLTAKRRRFVMGASGESEVITATRRKLATKGMVGGEDWSINLNLTSTGLGAVLDFIADAARQKPREINIILDRKGIEDQGVSLDDPIDLNVKDVSIEQAMKMVLGEDLGYVIQDDGSVLISSRDRLNQDLPVTAYFVGDLITQVPDFGESVPRMTIADVLSQTGGGGGGTVSLFDDMTTTDDGESGTQRLRDLIERTVRSTEPWESMGGRATLDFYERSGLMLVSQTADGHQKLQSLLESLRRERAIMISIEARFITVSDAFLNDVTLDFDLEFQSLSNKWGAPGAANWGPEGAPVPASNANVLTTYNTIGGAAPIVIGSTSSNGAGTSTLQPGLSIMGGLFGGTWGANEGGMVISGTILDDIQLGFLIRAIQADRRSTLLFAPRLTLWNGQRSWISDGVHSAYVSDLEPVVAEAAVGWDPTISYLVSGAVLDVKATASADRRYVQLDLRPQVAHPPNLTNTTVVTAAVPGGIATATITLPVVQVTHLMTSVSVPDGGTLLIGGLKMFEEHDVEAGVPVLSKIPLLKRLFSNRAQVRGQSNLMVLVKPVIIIQAEKEEELGVDDMGG